MPKTRDGAEAFLTRFNARLDQAAKPDGAPDTRLYRKAVRERMTSAGG